MDSSSPITDVDSDSPSGNERYVYHNEDPVPLWVLELTARMGGTWIPFFRKNIRNTVKFLRKLRTLEKGRAPTQQFLFLIDLLDWIKSGTQTYREWSTLLEHGLQDVLLDILLDQQLYQLSFPVLMDHIQFIAAIFLILLAIHEQVALGPWLDDPATHPRPRRSRKLELVITKFLVKLRQLWKVIWQYRDVFIPPLNTGRRRFLRPTSGEPMECTVSFMLALQIHQWNERYKDYKPNADSWDGKYALRILLFLWVQADYAPALKFYMREATAMLATCECHALRPMVGDAVLDVLRATTNPDGSSEFMRSACDVLLYEETILDDDLEQILHLLDVVQFVDYHTFMQVDEDMVDCDLLAAITTCCQRQLCCGDPSYDFNIISSGVLLVGYLVQTPGSPFLEIAKEDLIGHKFLPIVARGGLLRILDYDHEPSNRDYLLSLTIVLEAYYGLIREMLRADPEDPEVRTFRRIFRTVWYPTLKGMERLSLNFQPEDRRWGPIQLWIAIGGLLGLTVDQEAIDHSYFLDKLQRTFPRGRTRRCHWRECLCAHEPSGIAPHRIRTCNGCRSVYYCSTRCQAKDWEEGDHRDECRHMRLLESC